MRKPRRKAPDNQSEPLVVFWRHANTRRTQVNVKELSDRQLSVRILELAREVARRQRQPFAGRLSADELLYAKRHKAMQINNTSGAKGVTRNKRTGRWQAKIGVNGSIKHLGYFATVDEASAARSDAEIRYWGK